MPRQGSGKTLAYGLPILHRLLQEAYARPIPDSKARRPVRALVLAPTRELALQVSSHLNACLNSVDDDAAEPAKKTQAKGKGKGKGKPPNDAANQAKPPPLISVAAILGGMSAQKQKRVLARGVDVLVATPGRLWDILQEV